MGRVVDVVDHGTQAVAGVPVRIVEDVWRGGGSSFSVFREQDGFDLTGEVKGECFGTRPNADEIAELVRQAPPVRSVVTLTVVLELPGPLPTRREYLDEGGVQFVKLIERGEGNVLFAAADPGVAEYAQLLGSEDYVDQPKGWSPES